MDHIRESRKKGLAGARNCTVHHVYTVIANPFFLDKSDDQHIFPEDVEVTKEENVSDSEESPCTQQARARYSWLQDFQHCKIYCVKFSDLFLNMGKSATIIHLVFLR